MSTHNIGFYDDLTKIIFEKSSNIIKYAPYFFCCCLLEIIVLAEELSHLTSCLLTLTAFAEYLSFFSQSCEAYESYLERTLFRSEWLTTTVIQ